MKKRFFAALIAAVMTLALALPALAVGVRNAVPAPRYPTPAGYNDHDYQKLVAFLEIEDENGVKNGDKLSGIYDPEIPETWRDDVYGITWTYSSEKRVYHVSIGYYDLTGALDVSGCTALEELSCFHNAITELDVSGCSALENLGCGFNALTELNVSGCSALKYLNCGLNALTELDVSGCITLESLRCFNNALTELDVSGCTALWSMSCNYNALTELDVSGCIALVNLSCYDNALTELDLSTNPLLCYDFVRSDGNGHIGYEYHSYDSSGYVYAYPIGGSEFEGFFDSDGNLISQGEWVEGDNAYQYDLETEPIDGEIIARFSGGSVASGDPDGDGTVTVSDALIALRAAMGLITPTDEQQAACDVNGDGHVDINDALLILRYAMGLIASF